MLESLCLHVTFAVLGFGAFQLWPRILWQLSSSDVVCSNCTESKVIRESYDTALNGAGLKPSDINRIKESRVAQSQQSLGALRNSRGKSVRWNFMDSPNSPGKGTRVAILVPYRNRQVQLTEFLKRIHPFLSTQGIVYEVFVVEQSGQSLFNRGALFNIGYVEINIHLPAHQRFQCVVFHDVDLIPLEPDNLYDCLTIHGDGAWQLSSAIDIYHWDLPFKTTAGGVNMFTNEKFEKIRGFSNRFFGWGGEDDDLAFRLRAEKSSYKRSDKSVGLYHALKVGHTVDRKNPTRFELLRNTKRMYWREGLPTIRYKLLRRQVLNDHTLIRVDMWPHEDTDVFDPADTKLSEKELQAKYHFKPPPDVNHV